MSFDAKIVNTAISSQGKDHENLAPRRLEVMAWPRGPHDWMFLKCKGPFIATQLNSAQCRRQSAMQLTQLQRTANQRETGQSSWVELCRYKRALTLYGDNNAGRRWERSNSKRRIRVWRCTRVQTTSFDDLETHDRRLCPHCPSQRRPGFFHFHVYVFVWNNT